MTGNLSYDVPVTDHRERPAPEEPSVLRAARQAAGLSQEELAERSGLSVRNISNIERGRVTRPRRSSLDALADALPLGADQRRVLIAHYRRSTTHTEPLPIRNFLPRRVPAFAGRGAEIEWMRRLINAESGGLVCSIDGMAGVGKTALAVHVTHSLADRFPDGLLFLDLHGCTPGKRPLEPHAALAVLLRQIGVPGGRIPRQQMDRTALWHRELDGLRVLIVLDNAAAEDQVLSLLPGSPGCVTVVTSRRRLVALVGTVPLSLPTMPTPDALELFASVAGSDPASAAVGEIVRRCGHLPLAIGLAAARLRHRPSWAPEDLLRRLSDRCVLSELEASDQSVSAAFEVSYRQLEPCLRRAFRLLGVAQMATFDSHAAAALLDVPLDASDRILEQLVDVHLVEQSGPDRYRFHDLLRNHAQRTAEAEEPPAARRAAAGRLLDYLLHVAFEANRVLEPYRRTIDPAITTAPTASPPVQESETAAVRWLETERTNLLTAIDFAAEGRWDAHVWQLAWALRAFHERCGYPEDWLHSHELALQASRRGGDKLGECLTLDNLCWILRLVGRRKEAMELALRNLEVSIEAGDPFAEAVARSELGHQYRLAGDYDLAERYVREALTVLGDGSSGTVRHARAIYLSNLAVIHERAGRHQEAVSGLLAALDLFRALGDRDNQGLNLRFLGIARTRLGDHRSALACLTESLKIAKEFGDRRKEGRALMALGALRLTMDRPEDAVEVLHESLNALRAVSARPDQVSTLANLGVAYDMLGQFDAASRWHREALELAEEFEAVDLISEILNNTGETCLATGDVTGSERCHTAALELATRIALSQEQARARRGLGRCAAARNGTGGS